jgi:hypothetical protein
VLRYTITVKNSAQIAATGVVLTRHGSGEYHLRREFHAAQRIARRPAGRRRIAARSRASALGTISAGGQRESFSSTCASTRHARGHRDQQPGRGDSRGCRTC